MFKQRKHSIQSKFALSTLLFVFLSFNSLLHAQETELSFNKTIVLDADTANEIDDLYAVVAALIEPTWNIKALNATHWQTSHWTSDNSMEDSHRLNQVLLGYLQKPVPTKRGGVARMFDWGDQAQHSAAAYEIIKQAHAMPMGERLTVIALGALTNVGSALFIDPSIAEKINLYWLGTSYDFENGILGTTDFNAIMDTQALHLLLKSDVPMTIIPVNVAVDMQFNRQDTEQRLSGLHPLGDFLVSRWTNHMDGSRYDRAIWDLALIYAMMEPEWAETTQITTSKDFGSRPITYISKIDGEQMYQAFFERFKAHVAK
uniref:nucleoside hydrolase n=1 Tax=Ningiella ruwaisensis TaxID=2364274 RepID=UPI0010A0B8EE|nr:nucleoside hydrolase [Ningiella ruwaisensis]